jgi:hypothetical protein
VTEPAPGDVAIHHLQRIAMREPMYRPAVFTLGYLRLREGDLAEAERLFASLLEPFDKEADLRLADAREKWPQTGVRSGYGFLYRIKPIARELHSRIEQWLHMFALIQGGELNRAAENWSTFDKSLAESKEPGLISDATRQLMLSR